MNRNVWGIHDTQGFGSTKPSGCGFYRILLPLDELAQHGWRTGYGLSLPDYDPAIIVGQRFDQAEAIPTWKALKGTQYKLVYEIDDDPFSVDDVNWLALPMYSQQEVLDTIRTCAEVADLVTVSTPPLAEVFRQFNDNVTVIPNCVPAGLLAVKRPHRTQLTIGWGGGASHFRDLAMIAPVWREVLDGTGARGHFVGTDYRNMLRPRNFTYTSWETDPWGYYRKLDFDIGLAPIADHPFGRSKSHIKALEYAALGIPCIASDCEAYRDFVIDGVTGFLVRTRHEWREAMLLLAGDERLRLEMGRKAQELAREWTIQARWQLWEDTYCGLLGDSQ